MKCDTMCLLPAEGGYSALPTMENPMFTETGLNPYSKDHNGQSELAEI